MSEHANGNGNGVGQRLGLDGLWKNLAGFGCVGLLCFSQWYLVSVELPSQRKDYLSELRTQRDHDTSRTAKIWEAINNLEDEARLAHRKVAADARE